MAKLVNDLGEEIELDERFDLEIIQALLAEEDHASIDAYLEEVLLDGNQDIEEAPEEEDEEVFIAQRGAVHKEDRFKGVIPRSEEEALTFDDGKPVGYFIGTGGKLNFTSSARADVIKNYNKKHFKQAGYDSEESLRNDFDNYGFAVTVGEDGRRYATTGLSGDNAYVDVADYLYRTGSFSDNDFTLDKDTINRRLKESLQRTYDGERTVGDDFDENYRELNQIRHLAQDYNRTFLPEENPSRVSDVLDLSSRQTIADTSSSKLAPTRSGSMFYNLSKKATTPEEKQRIQESKIRFSDPSTPLKGYDYDVLRDYLRAVRSGQAEIKQ